MKNNKGKNYPWPPEQSGPQSFAAAHPAKKKYNARQVIEKLQISNSKDSVLHVLKTLGRKVVSSFHKTISVEQGKFSLAAKSKTALPSPAG